LIQAGERKRFATGFALQVDFEAVSVRMRAKKIGDRAQARRLLVGGVIDVDPFI
jgi:hypothetical protein